jgi:hypothetical protein
MSFIRVSALIRVSISLPAPAVCCIMILEEKPSVCPMTKDIPVYINQIMIGYMNIGNKTT